MVGGRRGTAMNRSRTRRRWLAGLPAGTLAVTGLTAATGPAAHAAPPGGDQEHGHGKDPRLMRILRSMTLEDKAAQLFVLQIHGLSADTDDPAAVEANRRLYGADNAAQVMARYRPDRKSTRLNSSHVK